MSGHGVALGPRPAHEDDAPACGSRVTMAVQMLVDGVQVLGSPVSAWCPCGQHGMPAIVRQKAWEAECLDIHPLCVSACMCYVFSVLMKWALLSCFAIPVGTLDLKIC